MILKKQGIHIELSGEEQKQLSQILCVAEKIFNQAAHGQQSLYLEDYSLKRVCELAFFCTTLCEEL
jgi:hypothetical protein